MRVLTGSGLIVGRLRWDEWLILGVYAGLVLWPEWLLRLSLRRQLHPATSEILSLTFVGFIVGIIMVCLSPGTRFRNVFFSLGWLGLSGWVAISSGGKVLAPLLLFALYHATRWHFWRQYQRELVPASISRAGYEREYYRLEKRRGTADDIRYTKLLFRVGLVLLFLLFWVSIRTLE